MKIIVDAKPYCCDDITLTQNYNKKCAIEISEDASVQDYLNALIDAMCLETFSKEAIYHGMNRYIEQLKEEGAFKYDDSY